jgi:TRAP-type uncharacterized transport system substrate-binding protein
MEKVICKCGGASIKYECIDEDLYTADAYNTLIVTEGYGKACICKSCKATYDHFDPCMVKYIKRVIH